MTTNVSDVQARYEKIASVYDTWDAIPERLFYRTWRRHLWGKVTAERILEIGVGTGKNINFYPPGAQVTAVDLSSGMLEKAAVRIPSRPDVAVELLEMDANELAFDSALFDTVVGSFVFMVVPDPLKVLQEVRRVCKPGGRLFILEFARSDNRLVVFLQGLVTYLTQAIYCADVNRDIVRLVESSGFQVITVEELANGIVKVIQATPSSSGGKSGADATITIP